MEQDLTLAQRVEALEREVAFLKMRLVQLTTPPNWLERVSGSMKDEPAFEEVLRLGREFRDADRPKDES